MVIRRKQRSLCQTGSGSGPVDQDGGSALGDAVQLNAAADDVKDRIRGVLLSEQRLIFVKIDGPQRGIGQGGQRKR